MISRQGITFWMKLIEIFKSRQGEGPHAGKEAIFLRLALCNLHCVWCDTKYSWYGGNEVGVLEVFRRIVEMSNNEVKHLVVTGGEPLLWRRELSRLLSMVRDLGYFIEVETNGTISPGELVYLVDEFNVSPKLSNSGLPIRVRFNEKALMDFVRSSKAVFKFVVDKPTDLEEVLWFINRFRIPKDRVYLMSQCITTEECLRKDEEVTRPMAIKLGVNYTPRLHILYGFR
jgi:organic radical activating enzyme